MKIQSLDTSRGLHLVLLALTVTTCMGMAGCASTGGGDEPSLFYPAPPQRPRIQFLTQFAGAEDVEGDDEVLMKFLVGDVKSERKMRKPTGVAAHDGVIYVADPGWDTVLLLDLEEEIFDTIQDRGDGKLQVPVAIAIDPQGNKFVVDSGRNQIVQFNEKNEYVRAFGDPDELLPSGVAVDESALYITNRSKHRVEVVDRRTKQTLRTIGGFGKKDGQFNTPTSLTLDGRGHLFVTDAANFRIQEFDPDGKFVKSFGFLGDGPGTFARPKGSGVDRSGHLYVVDAAFENVQIWDTKSAEVLLAFGGAGVGRGQMYLPASVYVSYDMNEYFSELVDRDFVLEYVILAVNNYGPNKVAVYGFINPRDPSRYEESPASTGSSED